MKPISLVLMSLLIFVNAATLSGCSSRGSGNDPFGYGNRSSNSGYGNRGYGSGNRDYDDDYYDRSPDYRGRDRNRDRDRDYRNRDRYDDHRDHDRDYRNNQYPTARPQAAPRSSGSTPACPSGTRFDGQSCIITDSRLRRPGGDGRINPCPKGQWMSGGRCIPG